LTQPVLDLELVEAIGQVRDNPRNIGRDMVNLEPLRAFRLEQRLFPEMHIVRCSKAAHEMLGALKDKIPSQVREAQQQGTPVRHHGHVLIVAENYAYILEHSRPFFLSEPHVYNRLK
jgi:hypothetical protein